MRRAGLPGRGLPQQAIGAPVRIVEDAEAHPFEVGNAWRQQAFGPGDAARIENGPRRLPDGPFLRSGTAPAHTRGAVHGIHSTTATL